MLKPTAAIVDLDGTLVDTLDDFTAALNGMLTELALPAPVPREVVERYVGKGSEFLVHSIVNRAVVSANAGFSAIEIEALLASAGAAYQRHYRAVNGQFARVYAGAEAGLQIMKAAGLKLACVTNKPGAFARELLVAKGLAGYFDEVFGGDAFERKKPDPLPLLKACEALGSVPARTLVVGDSSNDAQAARAAGCPVVLVTYGYNHGEPVRAVHADGFVDSLAELGASPVLLGNGG